MTPFLDTTAIQLLVWRGGMRYCTWICSCGGLAETVGDEWRQFSPKGPANTKREVTMYFVLGATFLIMLMSGMPFILLVLVKTLRESTIQDTTNAEQQIWRNILAIGLTDSPPT